MKKAQVSVELMMVVGFVLVLFIPLLLVAYYNVIELNDDLLNIQANVAVERLSNTIDSIGRMGIGSSIIIDVYVPQKSTLEFRTYPDAGTEIVIRLQRISGESESVGTSWYSIETVNIPAQLDGSVNYRFNITSDLDKVIVTPYYG